MGDIPVLELAGSPAERGYQHGRALAASIRRLYQHWISAAAAADPPIHERDALAYVMGHLPESRAYAPDLVQEVDGIARGADMPFEQVWLLNCFDEADGYPIYRKVNAGHSCTTFAATGLSTIGKHTYVGQTWDVVEWYEPVILRIAPGEGEIGTVMFSHPGVVAGSGINAAGLAMVWNTLRCRDARNGVPCTFFIRKALQQSKLGDAVVAAVGGVRACGFNFIIAADFAAVNIEASATRERIRYIGRHLGHANHYEEPGLLEFEAHRSSDPPGTSLIRSGRMNQLLDEVAGHIDWATCQALLTDHANYPGSICRHKDPPRSEYYTRAALLYDPARGVMLVTAGPACEHPWEEHRVDLTAARPRG